MKLSIRAVIREALIVHKERDMQVSMIKNILGVNREKAKELLFSFLYNAQDDFLLNLANKPNIRYKASTPMIERDMGHYIVINRNDINDYLSSHGKETLQQILEGIESNRLKNGKPVRDYVVVSNKRPELYETVWDAVLHTIQKEQNE